MTSMTIVCKDINDVTPECLENYADWMLENGWLALADKILINNKTYYDIKVDGDKRAAWLVQLRGSRLARGQLNYLTETEADMPTEMALLQLVLGLQTCKTKEDAKKLLEDAFELGRRSNARI